MMRWTVRRTMMSWTREEMDHEEDHDEMDREEDHDEMDSEEDHDMDREEDHDEMDHEEDYDEMNHEEEEFDEKIPDEEDLDDDHDEIDHDDQDCYKILDEEDHEESHDEEDPEEDIDEEASHEIPDYLEGAFTLNQWKMLDEIILRRQFAGCWKSEELNRVILDVINVACYSDGLNGDFLKVSALCMLKDWDHKHPENACPECKHLVRSQNNESRNQNTEGESTNQNSKPESKAINIDDLYGSLNHHQQMIRHLCRAALQKLKDKNEDNENIDVIKHGIFCQHEYLFLDTVRYVCSHLVDCLDIAAINEALLTRTMMTQMFLEYGVEDDRVIEDVKLDYPLTTRTMTREIFSLLHFLKWPPQEIETSKYEELQMTVLLVKTHLQTLLAYGFLNPNAIDVKYLIDIHRYFVTSICLPLLSNESHYKLRLECQEQKRELEGKSKEKKDEGRIQKLTSFIEVCNKSVVTSFAPNVQKKVVQDNEKGREKLAY